MAINYALYINHLTHTDDYVAVVQDQTTKTQDELIDRMIGRGSTVTKAEALSVLEEYHAAVQEALEEGFSISTPLFRVSPSIQGVFDSSEDVFDRKRHMLRLNVFSGNRIAKIADTLKLQKVAAKSPQPDPTTFKDVSTDTLNQTLSPGSVGELTGSRLKIDPADNLQGVFFIAANGTETRVSTYIRNMPSNLIFVIPPSLVAGSYHLEVRAVFQNNKSIRSGFLSAELTIL